MWWDVQFYQMLAMWQPWAHSYYLQALRRLIIVAVIGILGLITGVVVLATRSSVQNNLRSTGILWIFFGIIGFVALGGLFALIAGILALNENRDTGGIPRTTPQPVWHPRGPSTEPYARRVVCRSCNAMGDSDDRYCAVCGAAMNG